MPRTTVTPSQKDHVLAIARAHRVVSDGDGRAGGQQDQRVQKRQPPRVERDDALGRPGSVRDLIDQGQAGVEECPEEGEEEHHLGGDEQQKANAQAVIHGFGMIDAGPRLADDVAPPEVERGEQNGEAGDEHPGGPAVHEPDAPRRQRQRGDGPNRRPRARARPYGRGGTWLPLGSPFLAPSAASCFFVR